MVIFLDIDGTLCDVRGDMPELTEQALRQAKENGHKLIIGSGRSMCEIYPSLRESGLFDGYVAGAGTYVTLNGKVLRDRPMRADQVIHIIDQLQRYGAEFICEGNDFMYEYRDSIHNLIECAVAVLGEDDRERITDNYERIVRKIAPGDITLDEAKAFVKSHEINKILYYNCEVPQEQMQRDMAGCLILPSSFIKGRTDIGEISEQGVSKADGVQLICQELGVSKSEAIAFGDGANDKEMLLAAGTGVAMGNAGEELKQIAAYVTDDFDRGGIFSAFKHFELI